MTEKNDRNNKLEIRKCSISPVDSNMCMICKRGIQIHDIIFRDGYAQDPIKYLEILMNPIDWGTIVRDICGQQYRISVENKIEKEQKANRINIVEKIRSKF